MLITISTPVTYHIVLAIFSPLFHTPQPRPRRKYIPTLHFRRGISSPVSIARGLLRPFPWHFDEYLGRIPSTEAVVVENGR